MRNERLAAGSDLGREKSHMIENLDMIAKTSG